MRLTTHAAAAAILVASVTNARAAVVTSAAVITSAADPLLTNAKLIDFSEVPNQTPNPTISGVSFVGVGSMIYTISESENLPEPPWLCNTRFPVISEGGLDFEIQFSTPAQAFGSFFGGINLPVTIEAFNGAHSLGITEFRTTSPFGVVFRGLGFESRVITKALVSVQFEDIIILDDFHYVIPEPSSVALVGVFMVVMFLTPPTAQPITLRRHPRFDEDFAKQLPSDVEEDRWIFWQAAVWPDLARGFKGEDRKLYDHPTWHYINLPLFVGGERPIFDVNRSMDYPTPIEQSKWNVIQSIKHCQATLAGDASPSDKALAYCWLFHLVGDLHQPLHSTALFSERFPTGDRGGNLIQTVEGRNLHALWDGLLGRRRRPGT